MTGEAAASGQEKQTTLIDDLADYFAEYGTGEEGEQTELDVTFNEATLFVRKKAGEIDKTTLLYLYARFKYAHEGPCTTPRPSGFFNFEAKAKWDTWNNLKSSLTKERAKEEYVDKLDEVMPSWRDKKGAASGADKSGTFGIKLSLMANSEQEIDEKDKDPFDFIREGSLAKLKAYLEKNKKYIVNGKDANGLTLMMCACDVGHLDIVKYLAHLKSIDLNSQDNDGQTALHYAVTCEHKQIVEYLVGLKGIKLDIADNDGSTPLDVAEKDEIRSLLKK